MDVLLLPQGEHFGSGLAVHAAPAGEDEDEDEVPQPPAENGAKHHHQDELGEGHKDLREAQHDLVEEPALVAAVAAQQHADDGGPQGGAQADEDGEPSAVEGAGEHIPAQLIGAEEVGQGGRLGHGAQVGGEGVVGGDQGRQDAGQEDNSEHHDTYDGQPVLHHFADCAAGFALTQPASLLGVPELVELPVQTGAPSCC